MEGFTAEQYTASLAKQNAVLQSQVFDLKKQLSAQARELERLNKAMEDKEKHYLFHLREVDGENRELNEQLKQVVRS